MINPAFYCLRLYPAIFRAWAFLLVKWFLVGCGGVGCGAIWLGGVSWAYLLPGRALPGGIASAENCAEFVTCCRPGVALLKFPTLEKMRFADAL